MHGDLLPEAPRGDGRASPRRGVGRSESGGSSPAREEFRVRDYMRLDAEKKFFLVTTTSSVEGYDKILRYDLERLLRYGAIATVFCKGTVFTMSRHALTHLLTMLFFSLAVSCLIFAAHAHDTRAILGFDTNSLTELSGQINSLVPFVLGLYLSLSLSRWWEFRAVGLGKIFEQLTSVVMLMAVELTEPRWETVRVTVAKFSIASIDLIVQAARRRPDLDRLVSDGLINRHQRQALENLRDPWERPMVCWAWIMRISLSAMDYNRNPAPRTSFLMSRCLEAKDAMLMLNTYMETPLPFGYVHLISCLVNIQNIVMAVSTGFVVAQRLVDSQFYVIVEQVFALCVLTCLYQGILLISYVIADPLGDEELDFPITGFMNHVMLTVNAIFKMQADCPVVSDNGMLHHPSAGGSDDYFGQGVSSDFQEFGG